MSRSSWLVEEEQVAGSSMSRARHARACSPPERRPTGVSKLLRAEEEALRPARDVDAPALEDDGVAVGGERPLQGDPGARPGAVLDRRGRPSGPGRARPVPLVRRLLTVRRRERALPAAVRAEDPRRCSGAREGPPRTISVAVALGRGLRHPSSRFVFRSVADEVEVHADERERESRSASSPAADGPRRLRLPLAGRARACARATPARPDAVAERLLVGRLPARSSSFFSR